MIPITAYYRNVTLSGGRLSDLRFLKKLAKNSLRFSSMAKAERKDCEQKFVAKWDKFVNNELGDMYKNEPNIDIN